MPDKADPRPRIYADFNGLVAGIRDPARTAVVLDTVGTACDLANAGIVLHDGCELVAYDWSDEEEDLEGHGTAHFDPVRRRWIAELDEQGVRYVPKRDRTPVTAFRCVACRQDLSSWLASKHGLTMSALSAAMLKGLSSADELCPSCYTPIFAPIAPPA